MIRLHRPLAALALFAWPVFAHAAPSDLRAALVGGHGRGFEIKIGVGADHIPTPRFQPPRVWVPGRYECRVEQVYVPGCVRREWVPPLFAWRVTSCGQRFQVQIRAGYWRDVATPGHYEEREVKVWVPGHWKSQAC